MAGSVITSYQHPSQFQQVQIFCIAPLLNKEIASSIKARVSVFYDTFSTVCLDSSVTFPRHPGHVLYVEMLEAPAVLGDTLHPAVTDQGAALHTQFLQVGTVFREKFESQV